MTSKNFRFTRKTRVIAMLVVPVTVLFIGALLATQFMHGAARAATSNVKQPSAQVRNYTFYIRDNWMKMPDGQRIYVIGYTDKPQGAAQVPGPAIVVDQGDTVNVTVINDKASLSNNFPNAAGNLTTAPLQTVDGLQLPSELDKEIGAGPIAKSGQNWQKVSYHFVAQQPGSYLYHDATPMHAQMGLYGALTIKPKGILSRAYPGAPPYNKEYTFVLSDMDSDAHKSTYDNLTKGSAAVDWTKYHPNYFFINSKVWPDTMMDSNDSLNVTVGQTVLVRLINAGSEVHMMHTHGHHFQVIGANGQKLAHPYYKDTLMLAPGETADISLFLNKPGRYMFHDHIEANTTNNGVYPGGMMTMININLPNGQNPVAMPDMGNK
ncbi:multicopper oxidase domain-containing protein [Dictyobacter kobayashii]|nr:multicopper oxidase domain-containing protein [Dictyobacter kobayashii]